MAQQYLMAKARNQLTGVTVMQKGLTGARLELRQRGLAQAQAQALAEKMTRSSGQAWQAFVDTYTA